MSVAIYQNQLIFLINSFLMILFMLKIQQVFLSSLLYNISTENLFLFILF